MSPPASITLIRSSACVVSRALEKLLVELRLAHRREPALPRRLVELGLELRHLCSSAGGGPSSRAGCASAPSLAIKFLHTSLAGSLGSSSSGPDEARPHVVHGRFLGARTSRAMGKDDRKEKKEKKEKKRKKEKKAKKLYEQVGYTNEDNPFGDGDLGRKFVWKKKVEKSAVEEMQARAPRAATTSAASAATTAAASGA